MLGALALWSILGAADRSPAPSPAAHVVQAGSLAVKQAFSPRMVPESCLTALLPQSENVDLSDLKKGQQLTSNQIINVDNFNFWFQSCPLPALITTSTEGRWFFPFTIEGYKPNENPESTELQASAVSFADTQTGFTLWDARPLALQAAISGTIYDTQDATFPPGHEPAAYITVTPPGNPSTGYQINFIQRSGTTTNKLIIGVPPQTDASLLRPEGAVIKKGDTLLELNHGGQVTFSNVVIHGQGSPSIQTTETVTNLNQIFTTNSNDQILYSTTGSVSSPETP